MEDRHTKAITTNNVTLVRDMIIEETFFSYFMEDRILLDSHVEEIKSHRTKAEKNGEFLRIIRRRGPKAMRVFIHALVETGQEHIADKLDPVISAEMKRLSKGSVNVNPTTRYIAQETHPPEPPPQPIGKDDDNPIIDVKVRFVDQRSQDFINKIHDKANYPVKLKSRGRALIINNEIFENEKKNRDGTNFDMMNLDSLLNQLGFETTVHSDKTAKEMSDIIARESSQPSHWESDSFILAIFSHGAQGAVYGTDMKTVSIDETIKTAFDGKNCPGLSGKPKLFVIQACQGKSSTEGVPVADDDKSDADEEASLSAAFKRLQAGDGDQQDAVPWAWGTSHQPSMPEPNEPEASQKIHNKGDMLVAYSTVSGYRSWRHPENGSWFIRTLVRVFMNYAYTEHVVDLLTRVRDAVSQRKTNLLAGGLYVQMPANDDTLRKKWFLYPGYVPQ